MPPFDQIQMSPFMLRGSHGRGGTDEFERSGSVRVDPVITRPEQPRYALRAQTIKVTEHLDGALELLRGSEALPFKTFERHQHLSATREADDSCSMDGWDAVLRKESLRVRKLQPLHNKLYII